jgi:hypothetical protein
MRHNRYKVRAEASERTEGWNVSHFMRHVREMLYLAVYERISPFARVM